MGHYPYENMLEKSVVIVDFRSRHVRVEIVFFYPFDVAGFDCKAHVDLLSLKLVEEASVVRSIRGSWVLVDKT